MSLVTSMVVGSFWLIDYKAGLGTDTNKVKYYCGLLLKRTCYMLAKEDLSLSKDKMKPLEGPIKSLHKVSEPSPIFK